MSWAPPDARDRAIAHWRNAPLRASARARKVRESLQQAYADRLAAYERERADYEQQLVPAMRAQVVAYFKCAAVWNELLRRELECVGRIRRMPDEQACRALTAAGKRAWRAFKHLLPPGHRLRAFRLFVFFNAHENPYGPWRSCQYHFVGVGSDGRAIRAVDAPWPKPGSVGNWPQPPRHPGEPSWQEMSDSERAVRRDEFRQWMAGEFAQAGLVPSDLDATAVARDVTTGEMRDTGLMPVMDYAPPTAPEQFTQLQMADGSWLHVFPNGRVLRVILGTNERPFDPRNA